MSGKEGRERERDGKADRGLGCKEGERKRSVRREKKGETKREGVQRLEREVRRARTDKKRQREKE